MDEDQRQGLPSQGQGAMGTLTVCMLWALPARLSGPGGWAQAYVSSLTFHPSAQMFQNLFAAQTQSPPPPDGQPLLLPLRAPGTLHRVGEGWRTPKFRGRASDRVIISHDDGLLVAPLQQGNHLVSLARGTRRTIREWLCLSALCVMMHWSPGFCVSLHSGDPSRNWNSMVWGSFAQKKH